MNREQRRRLKKKSKGNEKLAQKISTFEHRPNACSACAAAFDAKSKEQAQTWRVVVYENPTRVSLFCPTCINKTKEIIDDQRQTKDSFSYGRGNKANAN